MNEKREVRCITSDFRTRSEPDGDLFVEGYFSVFNSPYEIYPGATEVIAPTAFVDELEKDVRCLINHESRLVLGRTKASTLLLRVDEKGLWGEVKINPKDQDAMNLYERVKRKDVDQCSFGFDILDEEFEDLGDSVKWTVKRVKLYEVSIVTFPAYGDTLVSARAQQLENIRKRKADAFKTKMLNKLKGDA